MKEKKIIGNRVGCLRERTRREFFSAFIFLNPVFFLFLFLTLVLFLPSVGFENVLFFLQCELIERTVETLSQLGANIRAHTHHTLLAGCRDPSHWYPGIK